MLTRQDIMSNYSSFIAKKATLDRIRPFTLDDVNNVHHQFQQDQEGTFFFDLEGRRHQVELGRCLVIGTRPEDRRTTTPEKVNRYRVPVGEADGEGFQFYRLKEPRLLTCFDIPHAFALDNQNGGQVWHCPALDGGYVVWDHLQPDSPMRVIQRDIFHQTYERVESTKQ